jgi:hypothetical protein
MTRFSISIDDITPHPKSSTRVLDRCFELIEKFPDIKFNLFVPLAYWRTVPHPPESICQKPMKVSEFPEFCDVIRSLPPKNFEIGIHGYYHGIPGVSNNDEFKSISYKDAEAKFHQIFDEIYLSRLDSHIKNIFRPPAWRMSPEGIQAAYNSGITLLALSPKEYAQNSYCNAHKSFGKFTLYDANPPFDALCESVFNYQKYEVVYHACEWDKNYLSIDHTRQLENWIQKMSNQIHFSFLSEIET